MGFANKFKLLITRHDHSLSLNEQSLLLKRLNRLLGQHYPLLDALRTLQWNPKWNQTSKRIITGLKEGTSFDHVLGDLDFDPKIVSFLYFSMLHGNIREAIQQSTQIIDQQLAVSKKFKQVMRYPIVLFTIFVILLYFVQTTVYPSFLQLFSTSVYSSNVTIIGTLLIDFLFKSFFITTIVLIMCLIMWLIVRNRLTTEVKILFFTKLPLLSHYLRANFTFLFVIHLSSLLQAGLTLKESINILRSQNKVPILAFYSSYLMTELEIGTAISTVLPHCHLLEPELTDIFESNTSQDFLIKDLKMYADFLLNSIQNRMKKILNLIQPIFFMIIAISIIFLYLSLLIPMFQLIQTI